MKSLRLLLALPLVVLFSLCGTDALLADTILCPGHCDGNECHNGANDPCNQGCRTSIHGTHTVCGPWPCICGSGLSGRPWDNHPKTPSQAALTPAPPAQARIQAGQ